jgi:hypothetical protein
MALLVASLVVGLATPVRAQVVTDPRIAEFDPSPDHWTTLESGQQAVVRYELNMYSVGSSVPFATANMGKPNPEGDGKIRFDFTAAAATWSFPGGEYEARVSAVGPEGSALSEPSNPFTFTDADGCTYTISPSSVQAPAAGGSYTITVSTGATCGWTATTGLAWASLWVTSGTGNGSVPFEVSANTSSSSRSGTITVAGRTVTVSQAGAVAQLPAAFGKSSPASGATGLGSSVTLSWGASSGATGYQVCVDTTNDNACGATWQSAGTATTLTRTGLTGGTYYWQVRAQNTAGSTDANGGTWWAFTVASTTQQPAPTFVKQLPANGATGLGSSVTLTWSALSDAGYWVCWDTTNNNTCDSAWWPNGGGAGRSLTGLTAGTYYWQVRAQTAAGTTDANSGTWWSFTVGSGSTTQPPAAFAKASPASGATGLSSSVTLSWGASSGATSYEVCLDTTNDNACGAAWQSAGTATTLAQSGLAAGTYYWQVRAQNAAGTTDANGGTWWTFTVASTTQQPTTGFAKSSPANGAAGLGNSVTLTWSALSDAGYWVCWDTTNNNTCDSAWWPNGGGAGRALTGLTAGTYYWQVRAQTASGVLDANSGTWWSFTVGGSAPTTQLPAAFGKSSPANGATGLGNSVTLSWGASSGATSYEVCLDTTNDNACGTTWRAAYTSTSAGLVGLSPGTYYWQARALNASGITEANGGAWWTFTVTGATQPTGLTKLSPTSGTTGLGSTVTLSWSALPDAGYLVCWDTTNNNSCDQAWWPNAGVTARVLTNLPAGTYYWQVRGLNASGMVDADNGTWYSFTVR